MKSAILCGLCAVVLLAGCEPSALELNNRGVSEFQVGHLPQAKELFQQVLDKYPSNAESLFYMGRISQAEGFYEQAIYYYQCCLDANPRYHKAREYLAQAQKDAGPAGEKLQFIP